MSWACAICGCSSRSNRRRCPTCGNLRWIPTAKKDIRELAGPIKRIAPRGLLLPKPEKQTLVQDLNGVECGTCHVVIYRPEGVFDAEAFRAAREKHYSASPTCQVRK